MASVVVTGSSGFIGEKVCEGLLQKRHKVIGVDLTSTELMTNPNFVFAQCDVTDKDYVTNILKGGDIDVVVHLANSVDNDFDSYITDTEMKRAKTVDKFIYEAAEKYGVKAFVLLSTTQVYGLQKGREPIRETSAEKGSSNYVDLKLYSEKMLGKAVKKSDMVPVIARVAPIYTAEYTQNLRDKVYDSKEDVGYIFNDGNYGFTFCCLYNLVDFIKGIAAGPDGRYDGIYNICDSEILLAKDILDFEREHHRIGAVVQRSPGSGISFSKSKSKTDYRYFDPATTFMNWRIDNTKSKRIAPMKWTLSNTK